MKKKEDTRKAYKGFDKDLKCRDFQFEIGKEFREDEAKLCSKGFHACENPLDTFKYYAPAESRFCEVELDEVTDERESEDTKVCGKVIKIGAELSVADLCKAHFEYVTARCNPAKSNAAGDNESASAGVSGSASAGNCGSASAGNCGSASAGYRGSASAGNWGSASAGNCGSASAGKNGIACCRGGRVKGGLGCAICCAEIDDEGKNIGICAGIVDGKKIKADTWYTVKKGKFVEVKK